MLTTRSRALTVRLLGALTVLALAASACSNSSDGTTAGSTQAPGADASAVPVDGVPGVTDQEIRYAVFGTRENNPLGTCILDCFIDGINAYFAYRNSEGGIYGRKLALAPELDDQVGQNQVRALEIISANDTFGAFSAPLVASGYGDMAKAGIPLYTWAINFDEMSGHDSIFGNGGVSCVSCVDRGGVYAGTQVGATRVASLGYGVTQQSKDCVESQTKSVETYSSETGQQVVYKNDDLAFGLPNGVAPEVTAMKQAGVDFIMTCVDLNAMKTLAQELQRQGMGDVPMLHRNTYDESFVADGGDLFEGDVVQVFFRPFEADPGNSELQTYFDWMERTGSQLSELAMDGWINADLAYQGLVAAGPSFDRAGVVAATNKMTAYSAGGLINPVDWSRQHVPWTDEDPTTHNYAKECIALVRVTGGHFELVGDPAKPFECWDNTNRDWSDPVPTDVG